MAVNAVSSATFEPKNPEDLRKFLEANKDRCHEIWVVLAKKTFANPQHVSFVEAVDEAIKQGLVDSRTKTLSEQKYAVRFTKRKPLKSSCRFLSHSLH